jgi:hypothetical protein
LTFGVREGGRKELARSRGVREGGRKELARSHSKVKKKMRDFGRRG